MSTRPQLYKTYPTQTKRNFSFLMVHSHPSPRFNVGNGSSVYFCFRNLVPNIESGGRRQGVHREKTEVKFRLGLTEVYTYWNPFSWAPVDASQLVTRQSTHKYVYVYIYIYIYIYIYKKIHICVMYPQASLPWNVCLPKLFRQDAQGRLYHNLLRPAFG